MKLCEKLHFHSERKEHLTSLQWERSWKPGPSVTLQAQRGKTTQKEKVVKKTFKIPIYSHGIFETWLGIFSHLQLANQDKPWTLWHGFQIDSKQKTQPALTTHRQTTSLHQPDLSPKPFPAKPTEKTKLINPKLPAFPIFPLADTDKQNQNQS